MRFHGNSQTSHHLIYVGHLPRVNRQAPHWGVRWRLKRNCLKQWGIWPHPASQKAHVTVTRVLGPRERLMDEWENVRVAFKGGIDALVQGNYLVDDSPQWAIFECRQDASRRFEGPRIEVDIHYDGTP